MNLPVRKDERTTMRHPSRIPSQKVKKRDGLSMPLQLAVVDTSGRFVHRQPIRKRSSFGHCI